MNKIKDIRLKIKKYKQEITSLTNELEELEIELKKELKKSDYDILKHNWKLIIDVYKKNKPLLFDEIIINCFDLLQYSSKYGFGGVTGISLSNLCKFWTNGGMRKNSPIISIRETLSFNTGKHYLYKTFKEEDEVEDKTIQELVSKIEINKNENINKRFLSDWFNVIKEKAID